MLRVSRTIGAPLLRHASKAILSQSIKSIPSVINKPINQYNIISFNRFQSTSIKQESKPKLSSDQPQPKIYTYEDIKQLITHPDPNKILVDVREPDEFQEFALPNSINIPYKSTPGALDLSPEEFEDIFKFEKPSKDKELIFYCVAGVRSTAALDLAQIFGYEKLGNYVGSIQDWFAHEGQPEPETNDK